MFLLWNPGLNEVFNKYYKVKNYSTKLSHLRKKTLGKFTQNRLKHQQFRSPELILSACTIDNIFWTRSLRHDGWSKYWLRREYESMMYGSTCAHRDFVAIETILTRFWEGMLHHGLLVYFLDVDSMSQVMELVSFFFIGVVTFNCLWTLFHRSSWNRTVNPRFYKMELRCKIWYLTWLC